MNIGTSRPSPHDRVARVHVRMLTSAPSFAFNRREIREIEKRKRERRKKLQAKQKKAERERQDQFMRLMGGGQMGGYGGQQGNGMMPMYNMPMPMAMPPQAQQQQQPLAMPQPQPAQGNGTPSYSDQSGNPYAPRDER